MILMTGAKCRIIGKYDNGATVLAVGVELHVPIVVIGVFISLVAGTRAPVDSLGELVLKNNIK